MASHRRLSAAQPDVAIITGTEFSIEQSVFFIPAIKFINSQRLLKRAYFHRRVYEWVGHSTSCRQ